MTQRTEQTGKLLTAYFQNKDNPTAENMEALFDVIGEVDASAVLFPVLEIAYELADEIAIGNGVMTADYIRNCRAVTTILGEQASVAADAAAE